MNHKRTTSAARVRRSWARALGSSSVIALAAMVTPPAIAQAQTVSFDISSQPLSTALLMFGRQAGLSVLAPAPLVEGKTAPAVQGHLTSNDALQRLLAGSGLTFEFVNPSAVRVLVAEQAPPPVKTIAPTPVSGEAAERVVVTGTTISGVVPASSPVEIFTAADIEKTGATTAEQFVGKLTQNVSTLSQYASGATVTSNPNAVTSVDLRGLGVGTTLTLLNGHRLALSNSGQSADVSLIPVAAIERVEVLTDGASAIYGSDAVGGVINFVLRDDFDGAETRLSYGGVTQGGMRQADGSQSVGRSWSGGHILGSYNFHAASALRRDERDYSARSGAGTLTPTDTRHNVFATAAQDISDRFSISADAGFGWRKVKTDFTTPFPGLPQFDSHTDYSSKTEQVFGSTSAVYRFSDAIKASLDITYSEVDVAGQRLGVYFNQTPRIIVGPVDYGTNDKTLDVMAKLEGVMFALPGGEVRFSVGGGQLQEDFKGVSAVTAVQSAGTIGRRSPYVFGEMFVPLVQPSQDIPFVHRAQLSLAARYTDYQDTSDPSVGLDFGSSTDPKVGLLWAPSESLSFRGTYGTSFRAPSLTQLDPTSAGHYLVGQPIGGSPGTILALLTQPVPNLGPETAKTYTLGFDFAPDAVPGLMFRATYYNIDYTDRIASAPTGGLNPFDVPGQLPDLLYQPPSAGYVEDLLRSSPLFAGLNTTGINLSDPAAAAAALIALPNFWIYDNRLKNLSLSQQDGLDLSVSHRLSTSLGEASFGATATRVLSYRQKASRTSQVATATEIPGQPPHWRGRAFADLTSGDFNGTLALNYTDDYRNPWVAGSPAVDSWATVDLNLVYSLSPRAGGLSQGARISLSIQNLFDEDPPFVGDGSNQVLVAPIGFDPINANPLGRFIVLGLTKKW